ncbi:hypothetical protein HYX00_01675, partial [Candidatus Woesearchaeota archaeon]|nr:hypothetical protein [Candidatus Woesearchaeota archaeon]
MSEIKKEAIVILFFVFWVVTSLNVLADEVGCCTNPGAGSLTCSADRLTLRDRECCPKPEANFPSYYSSEQNQESPANSNECATNFFFPNTACSAVQTCALGCCCSESGGTIKPEAQCQGSGLTFHRSQTNCNQICPVPQCNDGRDNDNNGCADFENGDLGCTSPADNDESGGTCSRQGVGCNNPSYTPRLSNFEISLAKGQKKFLLRWRDECSENAVSYDILRCKGSECTNFELVGTATTISFEDTSGDLLFDTAYTYQIKAHYTPQTAVPTITKTANLGNIECLEQTNTNKFCIQEYYYNRYKNYLITNFPEEFSQNFQDGVRNEFGGKLNKPFLCNEFNQLLPGGTACPSNKLCIVTNNQPSCISKISCNYNAANPFGLYYTLQDCETNRYCFYDRSHSTVNSCFSCEPSMSCYDYKTEEACSRDNCRVRNCRWKNLANQIGIGVCISTSEYNCKWCDKKGTDNLENIKAFNEIFDLCTREKSNLLSEGQFKCYFRDGNSKNCDEVTCNDYSSAQCSTAQITHDENNRIRNPSTDDCGIKVCQNINNQCVKNADGDNALDCEGAECEKDYIPPNTTISPVIRRGILDRLLIQIYDKTSINGFSTLRTSQDYKTYLCVEPCGSNGHPYDASTTSRAIIISNLNAFDSDNGNRLLTLNEGTNVIRYYSQDPAKNIGEVKKITVEVHGNLDGPKILSIEVSDGSKVLDKYYTRNQKPTINVQFVEPAIVTFARLINRRTGFILSLQGSTQLNTRATFSITQDLPNGEYTFELNAKNGANIFMDQLFSAIIVIDNASPTLIIIPSNDAVITTSLVKINLTFSKEVNLETVNINSEDIKNRFSTTDNKEFIAEISLSDGNKRLEASANDYAGNQVSGYVSFIVDANPTAINLISPRFGTSSRYTFDIVLETDNNAICRFAIDNNFEFDFMDAFTATGSTIHTISNFNRIANGDTNTHKLNVRCNNGRGQSSKSFDINVDTTPPHLRNVFAYPNPIIERPSTTELTIEADEPVICKHSTTSREFSGMDNKFEGFDSNNFKTINKQSVTVENEGSYSYFVACKNKAELNSESKEIQFKVDLSIPISIISHTPEFFNSTDIVLAIETTKRSQCKFSETDNTAQNGEIFGAPGYSHTKQLKLNPGRHTFFVICRDQSLQRFSDVASITFTIDVTPPIILSVNDSSTLEDKPEFTWNTDSLRVKWNSIDNESRVSYHNYSLIESGTSNAIINWTTSYAN